MSDVNCPSLSLSLLCDECIPGCFCPTGEYKNAVGECVALSECHCVKEGHIIPANENLHFEDKVCHCSDGFLNCAATTVQSVQCPPGLVPVNETEDTTAVTCRDHPGLVSFSRCKCSNGLVFDEQTKSCVSPGSCSCYDNGVFYKSGSQDVFFHEHDGIQKCDCFAGEWTCQAKVATARECRVWGTRNFVSFDNHRFSWNVTCEVILVETDILSISIQRTPALEVRVFNHNFSF